MTVRIHDLAHGGEGVGRVEAPRDSEGEPEGRVCFVEGALPGELVRVAIDARHKRWLRGHVVELLAASEAPLRAEPPCPLADRCGGCSWQHVAPAAQAELKQGIVAGQLRRLPLPPKGPHFTIVASPSALGYRRRARMHYTRTPGGLSLGFFGHHSREVVDCERCLVLDAALDWALQQARAWASWLPSTGEILGLSNGREVVLGLPGVRPDPELEAAIRAVIEASQAAAEQDEQAPVLLGVQLRGGRGRHGVGQTWLELDSVPGSATLPVVQGPFTFSQAQAAQNHALVEHVADMAAAAGSGSAEGPRILELHAGVGNFSRVLARVGRRVWASDADREAVATLQRTVERWGLSVNVKRAQAERLLAKLAEGDRPYDVIVLDPPRAGIGEQAARDLAQVVRRRVVYVSCDPATLARDLQAMLAADASLRLVDVRVFDMMPMTPEVEVVATVERSGERSGDRSGAGR
nr:TRAM domain-containing protein [Pseudenhygromyxa sp. WMMC2535]